MPSTYSSNLKIELMSTGENSGTWGNITNTNLGTALEQAIVGYGSVNYVSDANLTISITNTNAAQAARALVLNVTSALSLTGTRELVVPTIEKQYIIQNNTTGSQSITVKTSAGTGITVPNGRKAHLYVDGTNVIQMFDFVDINGGTIDGTPIGGSSAAAGAFTSLTASGATTLNGAVALGDASGDLITVPGTINSNLLFTDNSFDIGANGATRPRNLFLAGAATIGGNLSVGGTLTLTGGVNLNGNVTVGDNASDTLTINSTITSNLLFTDGTYDIGASGTSRPRNLYLSGGAAMGGNLSVVGTSTLNDSVTITKAAGAFLNVTSSDTAAYSVIQIANTGTSGRAFQWGVGGSTAAAGLDGKLYLYDATTPAVRMLVNSTGQFGINATPIDRLTVGGSVVSIGSTSLTSANSAAIFDYDSSTSETRILSATPAGSMVGLWTNNTSGALLRRVYLDGLGRIKITTDNSSGTNAPQSWGTSQAVFELGNGGAWNASNSVGGTMSLTSNAYFNTGSAWIRRASGYAARIDALGTDGSVVLQTASSTGAAGSAITWDNLLTLNRNAALTLETTAAQGVGMYISNPNANNYSVLELRNTGASGRKYQVGVGGSSAPPANQFYIYDATPGTGAVRMAINSAGQIGFGTTAQGAFMHLYGPTADTSSMLIENGGNNDCGIRTKTALGDFKFGTGIGNAANSFNIYDIAASAQRFRIGFGGLTTVGTSINGIAKLAVQTVTNDGNVSNWSDGQFVVTTGGDNVGPGLGIAYQDSSNTAFISALQPGVAWRNLTLRLKEFKVLMNGSDLALSFDDSFKQPATPYRHAFKARNPQGTSQPSGTTLVFADVDLNAGSRYNATNGRFTAAVAGLYHFSHTALTYNVTNYFYASMYVNGGSAYVAWHTPQNPGTAADYQAYSWSATVYLNAGDYVDVRTQYNGGAPYVEGGTSSSRTTFSGHFVG